VRARSHAAIGGWRGGGNTWKAAASLANARYLAVERVLVLGLCVIYISGVAILAIRMLSGG
jgi:hypothetical protein